MELKRHPVTTQEWLFVKMLILHLDNVRRAAKSSLFVNLEGMKKDVREFFALPIPKAVWEKMRPFQDAEFVAFLDLHSRL